MRTIHKTYYYTCDVQGWGRSCPAEEEVHVGDAIPSFQGATFPNLLGKVRNGYDADLVMKRRYRWYVSNSVHLCPYHHPDNEANDERTSQVSRQEVDKPNDTRAGSEDA